MKTLSRDIEIIEHRVRDKEKMRHAYQKMDRLSRPAPSGWNSARVIRKLRQEHR